MVILCPISTAIQNMDFANLAAQLNAGTILPEVIITLLVVLVADLIVGVVRRVGSLCGARRSSSLIALYFQRDVTNPVSFLGAFNSDAPSIVLRGIIVLSAAGTILMSIRYIEQSGTALAEFIVLLLSATLGGMFYRGK